MTTFWTPVKVWLRYCSCVRQLDPYCVFVFAHELIHVEHPGWSEQEVYRWDNWYAAAVVGPAIRREQA